MELHLIDTWMPIVDLPHEFQSRKLLHFTFTSRSTFDVSQILRPIMLACEHLEILSLETQGEVGVDLLRLALSRRLTDFRLYGERARYDFDGLVDAVRSQSRLERMYISYPCPQSKREPLTVLHCHQLSTSLPRLSEIVFRLPPSSESFRGFSRNSNEMYVFKLRELSRQPCLALSAFFAGERESQADLHLLLDQVRRYSSHR